MNNVNPKHRTKNLSLILKLLIVSGHFMKSSKDFLRFEKNTDITTKLKFYF